MQRIRNFLAVRFKILTFCSPRSLTRRTHFMRYEGMNSIRAISVVLAVAAWSSVSAETVRFEDSAALLGASCAKDIDSNCRGVNLDPVRMKDCLYRNQDVLSAQCKNDYGRAFEAIAKRVAARAAVTKLCERDVAKLCPGTQKGSGEAI